MKAEEIVDVFRGMEDALNLALERLERAKEETETNATRVYWMCMQMQNHRQKFETEELETASFLEHELLDLTGNYNEMMKLSREILDEFEDSLQQISGRSDDPIGNLQEEININRLLDKMDVCLHEGQVCLERQRSVLEDVNTLDDELQKRLQKSNFSAWCQMLKKKFVKNHMWK
jgi:hypothetical protein